MKIVVDTNILFSAHLNPSGIIGKYFTLGREQLQFIAPAFLLFELKKHEVKLQKLSKLSNQDFLILTQLLLSNVRFIAEEEISETSFSLAEKLVDDIDSNYILFVALALEYETNLWTGDKKLKAGLLKKNFKNLINTKELEDLLNK